MLKKKIDPALKLSSVVSMKMTTEERALWGQKAAELGMTASALLRDVVLKSRTTIVAIPTTDHPMVQFLHLYLRLTNQIELLIKQAVFSLSIGDLSARDYERLLFSLDRVAQLFRQEFHHGD